MGRESERLSRVIRVVEPFFDRREFVRLDRNEDPDGWAADRLSEWLSSLTPYDIAAYPDSSDLVRGISDWQCLSDRQVVVTAGSDAGIKLIFETYLDPGDAILHLDPSWRMYEVWAAAYRAHLVGVPFGEGLVMDVDFLVARIREAKPRLVVIANPNQPTGTLLSLNELEEIAVASQEVGALLVIDEAYFMFSDITGKSLIGLYPHVLVVRTFSKAFGMAGLRVGYILSSEDRIEELKLLRPLSDASSLALSAASYSLAHIDWVESRVRSIIEARDFLHSEFASLGVGCFQSWTNFLLVNSPTASNAVACMSNCKLSGYLLKGPLEVGPEQNVIRISVGSKSTMEKFWNDCGDFFGQIPLDSR